jgi:UDP-glucose:(heptosyl)LPS alpha-1,3-glucosyltransferase
MRIGLVMEHFLPSGDRCGKWAYQLARELLSRGHEVHVVTQSSGEESQRLPIVVHNLGVIRSPLARAAAAGQMVHSLTLDLIHDFGTGWYCDVFQPFGGSCPAQWERSLSLAPAWSRSLQRALWPVWPGHHGLESLWTRQYINDGRLFVVPSRRTAEDLGQWHDVPRQRIRRVYSGVDTVRYSPFHRESYREPVRRRLQINDDSLLVLLVTDDPRVDGLQTLLRAMSLLSSRRAPVRLLVAGVKRWLAPARRAAAMRLSGNVIFVPPSHDLIPLYAAADIYVQPTLSDPNGIGTLEAMASGLPVITTEFNGISELVTAGREGFVLETPGDFEALASHIDALRDPSMRATMGQNSRQLSLRHTLVQNLQELTAVYEEVVLSQSVGLAGAAERRTQRGIPLANDALPSSTTRQQRVIHEHPSDPSKIGHRPLVPRRLHTDGTRSGNRPRRGS